MLFQKLHKNTLCSDRFVKKLSEVVNNVNQMMSYTRSRLIHCALTHNKKKLVRSRIFIVIKYTTPRI